MKKSVKITIKKESSKVNYAEYGTQFDVLSGTTVLELKTNIKSSIKILFEKVKESLYNGSEELKDADLLPNVFNLDYVLVVK
jgi:hypothetical protein